MIPARYSDRYDPDCSALEDARSDARADAVIDAEFERWRRAHPHWREEKEKVNDAVRGEGS